MPTSHSSGLDYFLEKLEARSSLSASDREAVLALRHTVKPMRRHEFIVREDDKPAHCCVLVSGFAIRHKTAGNGGRQIFSIHMRGEAVELHNSLLGTADHNVQMLSAGEAAFIPVAAIRELIASHPAIGAAILNETLVDAAIFREWTLNVGRRDARCRMAHMLCEFAVRLETSGLGAETNFELPMTQEELADALALTSIHVSRTLGGLAKEGLLARTSRAVKILDWHELAKVGDFDSGYLHLPSNP